MKKMVCLVVALLSLCNFVFLTSCQASDPDAPRGYVGMQDESGDYILYVPQTWVQDETHGMLSAYAEKDSAISVSVTAVSESRNATSMEEYWQSYREEFENTFADFQLIEEKTQTTLGGESAQKYVFSGTVAGKSYQFMQVLAERNAVIYTYTYSAPQERFDTMLEQAVAIQSNFVFR